MCCVMLSPMWQVRVVIYISPSSQTKTAPSTLRHWQIQWNRKSKGSQKIYELTGQKFESGENLVLWKTSVIPGRTPFYLWNYHFLRFRKVKVYTISYIHTCLGYSLGCIVLAESGLGVPEHMVYDGKAVDIKAPYFWAKRQSQIYFFCQTHVTLQ